ncbi:MAG: LysM peptidoglycan-binding domain-containing protein [Flavobacterium sp.]|uniref:LysM peptidoglycan-binding domain-containing protein n=1 Tax=Flavobacterium sp. TaxID=239 RepID=UPI0012085514|nr:LysM peptidoglycan-binding domain-containing protein [Flavobacterium sp.]RZJ67433.1 MAG: LysM peptidoglycan-binding domain-containing protein [Flavobacterium sp.]
MKYFLILLFSVFSFQLASAQDYVKHKVAKSESVTQIAKKYNVTPFDIYRLNPDAQNGVKENDVLLIPSSAQFVSSTVAAKPRTHVVAQGETLFSIARKFDVSVANLEKVNADILKSGLKTGQTISIPGGNTSIGAQPEVKSTEKKVSDSKAALVAQDGVSHTVQQGETKFSIAKKYRISVAELERQNPLIVSGLQSGTVLHIKSETRPSKTGDPVVEKPKPKVVEMDAPSTTTTETVKVPQKAGYANYEVKPKETMFSLTQQFNITQQELIALNPTLKDGVKSGMILKVPGKGSIAVETRRDYTDLAKNINKSAKKQLVLLLPFNAAKITADTTKGTAERLKKDAFLNLTLDFYSGALMAIDSARTLGLNIDVKILDSEESKSSSKVLDLIKANNLKNADALIGPFYQQHAEKAAAELGSVAVISPLSKEGSAAYPNLYQAMPSEAVAKKAMLDYLYSKGANIILVSDPKRNSTKELINGSYPDIKFAELDASGNVIADKLRASLVKDKQNYVVLDTEKTGMILATTNVLLSEISNFKVQIAILEQNETLDFEEVSMKRLTILKLVYPAMTRDNDSEAARAFRENYKAKNRVFPSQYATRGFDVTFDTMLRLSQGLSFAESAATQKTEQVEGKFDYGKSGEGVVNKGIYILQYNEDLSVKESE